MIKRFMTSLFVVMCFALMAQAQQPKAVVATPTTIKMPAERGKELKALQAQADKLKADFDGVMREIQLRGNALVTRAALEAGMTAAQLDSMDVALDAEGNYEWRPKPPKVDKPPAKGQDK